MPFAPFVLRYCINFFTNPSQVIIAKSIVTIPDFLIYSLTICIINLNINLNQKKNILEKAINGLYFIFIVFNCVLLGCIHLDVSIKNNTIISYLIVVIGVPIIFGVIYKFKYQK